MTREERIAEVQAILKETRKTATPEHKARIDGSLNWAEYESGRVNRQAGQGKGLEL